jgi:hypothetical protein
MVKKIEDWAISSQASGKPAEGSTTRNSSLVGYGEIPTNAEHNVTLVMGDTV